MEFSVKTLDRTCLVTVVVVSLVCGYVSVSRAVKHKRQVEQENELLSKRTEDLALAETSLQRLNWLLTSTRSEIEVLNESIPDSARMGRFLKRLSGYMEERGLVLVSLQPLETAEERLYTRIPLRMVFKGSFVDAYRLLYDLETMSRTLVMERMSITRSIIDQQCQVELTASVFER